jgi:hypothetical protein
MKNLVMLVLFALAANVNAALAGTHLSPETLEEHHVTVSISPIDNSTKKTLVVSIYPQNRHYQEELRCVANLDDFQVTIQQSPAEDKKSFLVVGELTTLRKLLIVFGTGNTSKDSYFYTVKLDRFIDESKKKNKVDGTFKLDTKEARTFVESNKMDIPEAAVRANLKLALHEYYVVTRQEFTHNYSHVGGMDASGYIEWPVVVPPVQWKWTLRPGGLAVLTKPDGTMIYLARENQKNQKKQNKSEQATPRKPSD